MKWLWTALIVAAVFGALWWLVDPRPGFYLIRIWLGLTLVLYSIERIAEEHR